MSVSLGRSGRSRSPPAAASVRCRWCAAAYYGTVHGHVRRASAPDGRLESDGPIRCSAHERVALHQIYGEPIVAGGRVFVADVTGEVVAINANHGCLLWSRRIPQGNPAYRGAVFGSDVALDEATKRLYLVDGAGNLAALDAAAGKVIWHTNVGGWPAEPKRIENSPTLLKGKVSVGTPSGDAVEVEANTDGAGKTTVTKTTIASFPDRIIFGALASDGIRLYGEALARDSDGFGVGNVTVIATTPDGTHKWDTDTGKLPTASPGAPAVAHDVVCAPADGAVVSLNAATGSILRETGTFGDFAATPSITNGVVYVGLSASDSSEGGRKRSTLRPARCDCSVGPLRPIRHRRLPTDVCLSARARGTQPPPQATSTRTG